MGVLKPFPIISLFYLIIIHSVFIWRPSHHTKTRPPRLKREDSIDGNSFCTKHFKHLHNPPGACQVVHLIPFPTNSQREEPHHLRQKRDIHQPPSLKPSNESWPKLLGAIDNDDDQNSLGALIYQFHLFDAPIQVRLLQNDEAKNSSTSTQQQFPTEEAGGGKILVQYYSHNSSGPVREDEITVRQDVKCIYDGYFDPDALSILLFDSQRGNGLSTVVGDKSRSNIHKNAVFNLCGSGMMGMFQMDGEQYFIEPLVNNASLEGVRNTNDPPSAHSKQARILDDHHGSFQPHIVYSLSSLKGYSFNEPSLSDWRQGGKIGETIVNDDFSHRPLALESFLSHNYNDEESEAPPSDYQTYDLPNVVSYSSVPNGTMEGLASNEKNNSPKLRRGKRSVSREHFIEIMMVADYEVAKAHGPDLQRYILTIMSIVEMIYKNPSIGNSINIALVKIAIFQDSEYSPKITENGKTILDNFCKWQYEHNTNSQYERYHHDTAVLLTRQDICSNEINCQALAITNGWICDPLSSCSIAEDNGLSVALTIAHELGHNLGLPHDGDALCKEFKGQGEDLEKYHIMSEVLNPTTRSLSWSDCSHHYLTAFLDKGHGQCLLNTPENLEYMAQMKALRHPGEEYSVHQQCQLIFGPYSHYCPNKLPPCQLYCLNKDHRCQADFIPWADGTPCGDHRWCQSGKCVDKTYHTVPVDGGWGEWSQYTPCSRSCGGGVMTASRTCTNPTPSNNGKYCLGRRTRVKSCNTQGCLYKSDFRDEQCAKMNGNNMGFVGVPLDVKWRAAYDIPSTDKCKLYCYASDSTAYKLSNKVIDGTPCDPESTQICIQGICKPVGCDQILGSSAKFDRCGVCGGDNSTCRTVSGSYNEIHYGYNNVGRIPRGAMNIDVRQYGMHGIEADDNYLALMDSKGNYLINGDNSITMTRLDTKFGGVFLQYTGSNTAVERINATDMIKEDLIIQVLTVGHLYPPDIRYSYDISSTFKAPANVYIWNTYGPWSRCSCKGVRTRKILCMDSKTYDIESNSKCSSLPKPLPIVQQCRSECDFRWHVIDRTPCSVTCGHGFQKNIVVCVRLNEEMPLEGIATQAPPSPASLNLSSIVANSECENDPRKPPFIQPCYLKPCPLITHWEYTPWSPCSVSCGGGVRTRKATCKDEYNRTVGPHLCNSTLTVLSQICQTSPCPSWKTSTWNACSSPCGAGVRTRQVWCQQENQQIDHRFCPAHTRPLEREACNSWARCLWNFSQWGPCSSSCGHGYKTRSVYCVVKPETPNSSTLHHNVNAANYYVVDAAHCDQGSKPVNIESCVSRDCQLINHNRENYNAKDDARNSALLDDKIQKLETYRASELTLPPGFKNRLNFQRNDQHRLTALPLEVAPKMEAHPPKLNWRTGAWTSCSSPCGDGVQEREVACHYENGTKFGDERLCQTYVAKPVTSRRCKVKFCGDWRVGSWQKCLAPCGQGTKNRYVACVLYASGQITDESNCDPKQKPTSRVDCMLKPCPTMITQPVPVPAKSTYIASNHVTRGTKAYPNAFKTYQRSLHATIPDDVRTNSIADDNSYKFKSLNVVMVNPVQPLRPQQHPTTPRPAHTSANRAPSNITQISRGAIWRIGPWTRCSVACGVGWKRRLVLCQTYQGKNSYDCNMAHKPANIRECFDKPCYIWQLEPSWSVCNATCGSPGYRTRKAVCLRESDKITEPDHKCDRSNKPANAITQCQAPPCLGNKEVRGADVKTTHVRHKKNRVDSTLWDEAGVNNGTRRPHLSIGAWGPCSGSCGIGFQKRHIRCFHASEEVAPLKCRNLLLTKKLATIRYCQAKRSCQYYEWKSSEWSSDRCELNCSSHVIRGAQTRNVDCVDLKGRLMPELLCQQRSRKKPVATRPCNESYGVVKKFNCPLGEGPAQNASGPILYRPGVSLTTPPTSTTSTLTEPASFKYSWHKSAWTKCTSNTCSLGLKFRRVWCAPDTNATQQTPHDPSSSVGWFKNGSFCRKGPKPKSIKTCRINHMCKVKSCSELKIRANISTDGTYDIMVRGLRKKIYCHAMKSASPKEYLALSTGDSINYSQFYDKRLIIPNACPEFDPKIGDCKCVKTENNMSGITHFSKIRLELTNLRIIGNDFTFSNTTAGSQIPYATAGDCFSLAKCPQGKFNVDLSNTGFALAHSSQWDKFGHRSVIKISANQNLTQINGTCGGYCGRCTVHDEKGLVIIPI